MSTQTPVLRDISESPDIYLLEYIADKALLAKMTRKKYMDSIFTDRFRIQAASQEPIFIPINQLISACESINFSTMNFIVHPANCGSTLFSKALDLPGKNLIYREPFTLRQLGVEYSRSKSTPALKKIWSSRLQLSLRMMSRKYTERETPVIKSNIPINFILKDILSLIPDPRGIILYSDLKSFLISALKTPERRQWANQVFIEMSGTICSFPQFSNINYSKLEFANSAALLWVAQQLVFSQILENYNGFKSLKSNQFYENTNIALSKAFLHFGTEIPPSEVTSITNSPLFDRYSKNPNIEYNSEIRKSDNLRFETELGDELSETLSWAKDIITLNNINEELVNPLI